MCDTMVTITDEGVLFAKNSDRDPNEAQVVEFHAGGSNDVGDLKVTHTSVAQVEATYDVLISRPWWMWGAEMGANSQGVVIGNEAVFTRSVGNREGTLLGMDLLRLALERAGDRHQAVEVIVGLLERHGQGGSCSHEHPNFTYDNSFLIADRSGAVVLETAGRHHATDEVARSRSISNGLTIPAFARRFADPLRGRVAQCDARRGRTEATAGQARGVLDLFAGLRDHGGGSGRDCAQYSWVNGALAAPCAHAGGLLTSTQSTASWVAEVSADRHWVTATSAPCTSIFKPLAVGPVPVGEPEGIDSRFDERFGWWRHERAHRRWVAAPSEYAEAARRRDDLERTFVAGIEANQAWAQAAEWERSLPVAAVVEHRPALVRRLWNRWDQQSGVWS